MKLLISDLDAAYLEECELSVASPVLTDTIGRDVHNGIVASLLARLAESRRAHLDDLRRLHGSHEEVDVDYSVPASAAVH